MTLSSRFKSALHWGGAGLAVGGALIEYLWLEQSAFLATLLCLLIILVTLDAFRRLNSQYAQATLLFTAGTATLYASSRGLALLPFTGMLCLISIAALTLIPHAPSAQLPLRTRLALGLVFTELVLIINSVPTTAFLESGLATMIIITAIEALRHPRSKWMLISKPYLILTASLLVFHLATLVFQL